jgi:hypothetical protein
LFEDATLSAGHALVVGIPLFHCQLSMRLERRKAVLRSLPLDRDLVIVCWAELEIFIHAQITFGWLSVSENILRSIGLKSEIDEVVESSLVRGIWMHSIE